ncbi:hypothetical protein CHELA41_20609 [Hyphomicrobiales bacterium]|nr:hypothetical protein CHELA41_20609 [Hyphomicrobiales bacterium]
MRMRRPKLLLSRIVCINHPYRDDFTETFVKNPEKEPNGMILVFTAEHSSKTSRTGRIRPRTEKSQPRRGRGWRRR